MIRRRNNVVNERDKRCLPTQIACIFVRLMAKSATRQNLISSHGRTSSIAVRAMLLKRFLWDVYFPERHLKPESRRQLAMSIDAFLEFAGDVTLNDLSHEILNHWIETNPRGWAARTIRRRVADVITVWGYAYAIQATENAPNTRRVRRIRIARRLPDAWTLNQLDAMCKAAESETRYLPNGVRICDLLKATIYVGFYSALRAADLQQIRRGELSPHGVFVPQAKKHGDEVLVTIPQWVIEFIDDQYPVEIERVWAWPYRREYFYRVWNENVAKAGLQPGKRSGLQKLRRTSVTYGEAAKSGYGALLAGHKPGSPVTYHSYADPRIIAKSTGILLPDIRHTDGWKNVQ